MAGEQDAGLGDDLDTSGAEAMMRRHFGTDQPGIDRIRVALEGDETGLPDGVVGLDRRRVARARKGTDPSRVRPGPPRSGAVVVARRETPGRHGCR